MLDRITRKRNFVIADKVALTCDLSFACLASRRHEPMISHAFSAMQAVWDLPAGSAPRRSKRHDRGKASGDATTSDFGVVPADRFQRAPFLRCQQRCRWLSGIGRRDHRRGEGRRARTVTSPTTHQQHHVVDHSAHVSRCLVDRGPVGRHSPAVRRHPGLLHDPNATRSRARAELIEQLSPISIRQVSLVPTNLL